MKHVMKDVETCATHTSRSIILSVAAIPFELTPEKPIMGTPGLWVLNIAPQLMLKSRVFSRGTQKFWQDQPDGAAQHWEHPEKIIHPEELRGKLFEFINALGNLSDPLDVAANWMVDKVEICANGDRFDIGNLENLMWEYAGDENRSPWAYNKVNDYRTYCRWNPKLREMPKELEFLGHDPTEDCKKQIWRLWEVATPQLMADTVATPVVLDKIVT